MATLVKTDTGTCKAIIRKQGWPITSKTFRTERDAMDWARSIEDEMVRGVYSNTMLGWILRIAIETGMRQSAFAPCRKN